MDRRTIGVVLSLVVAIAGGAADLYACGDKFLRLGRSPRYRAYAAVHPTAILIYAPASASRDAVREYEETLRRAGHRVQAVWNVPAFVEAISSTRVGIVISSVQDVARLKAHAADAPSRPAILPIVTRTSRAERAAIDRDYPHILEADWTKYEVLAELDHVMEARLRLMPALP
jgi:hypothetical protein